MTERENLIEILGGMSGIAWSPSVRGIIADYLLANGVTIQKWIPVSERLPDPVSKHKRFSHEYTKTETVLCVCAQKGGKRMVKEGHCEFYGDTPVWRIPGTIDSVTNWMPLPKPPKEV